jgi:hypothetical protein
MVAKIHYASFLVRLWRTIGRLDGAPDSWLGELEHIQSGRLWNFNSLHELEDFLDVHWEGRSDFPWIEIVDREE